MQLAEWSGRGHGVFGQVTVSFSNEEVDSYHKSQILGRH